MIERDNLHFSFREIDGYNKPYNIVFCEREAGKTTSLELDKMINPFFNKRLRFAYLVRRIVEITEDLIDSIQIRINRFRDENNQIEFLYHKKEFRDGVVSLYVNIGGKKELIGKIIPLSMQLQRLKKIAIPDIQAMIFDEYVCNPRMNESYLKQEAFKVKELFTTLRRFEYKPGGLKVYLCGNPYSKFSPMIVDLNVDTNKMRSGARLVGGNYIVECYKIKQELKDKILKDNPLYKFDETYKKYAFDGEYINDNNIKIGTLPNNYYLRFVFNVENRYIGVYKNRQVALDENKYFVRFIKFDEVRKTSFCFDFADLVNGSVLMSNEESIIFSTFKVAMRERKVVFANVECYYLIEEIYKEL